MECRCKPKIEEVSSKIPAAGQRAKEQNYKKQNRKQHIDNSGSKAHKNHEMANSWDLVVDHQAHLIMTIKFVELTQMMNLKVLQMRELER